MLDQETRDQLNAAVDRGAALLDERLPGWHDRIDLDALDVRYGDVCVLAQLSGPLGGNVPHDYSAGKLAVGIDAGDAKMYGFSPVCSRDGGCICDETGDYLTGSWTALIEARRQPAAVAP